MSMTRDPAVAISHVWERIVAEIHICSSTHVVALPGPPLSLSPRAQLHLSTLAMFVLGEVDPAVNDLSEQITRDAEADAFKFSSFTKYGPSTVLACSS